MKTLLLLLALSAFTMPALAEEAPRESDQAAERVYREMYESAVNASRQRVIKLYPDAAKSGSPLAVALLAETDRLTKEKATILYCTEWPEYIAFKLASELGILPVKK